ncbi:MAG: hypothetical protein CMP10_07415 [Zetaproteobacteria bacterium]|nr:hypothetical protein [Pseudobdellovibrionaceae bacterium]
MNRLDGSLQRYYIHHVCFPTKAQGLDALAVSTGHMRWRGPYVDNRVNQMNL